MRRGEAQANGVMLSRRGHDAGIDPQTPLTGSESRVRTDWLWPDAGPSPPDDD
jgi:hypothetical protein